MTFEDLEPKNVTRKPVDLSTWNIEDLRDYIENMKAEIQRAEAMIAEKRSVSSARTLSSSVSHLPAGPCSAPSLTVSHERDQGEWVWGHWVWE